MLKQGVLPIPEPGLDSIIKPAIALRKRGAHHQFAVVSNSELLKEARRWPIFVQPDCIVLGIPPGPLFAHAREIMDRLYVPAASQPLVIVGRSLVPPRLMREEGIEYHSIGRATPLLS